MEKVKNLFYVSKTVSFEQKVYCEVRPCVSNGLWLMFLLPLVLIISSVKHAEVLTPTYRLLPLFSLGLILSSISIISRLENGKITQFYQLWCVVPISVFFYVFLNLGFTFSLYSGFFCTIIYNQMFLYILRNFPKTFTLGEAGLTSQAFVILLYTTLPHFNCSNGQPITKTGQTSTAIIQMELFGIAVLATFLKYFRMRRTIFVYFWMFIILLMTFLLPLHVFLHKSPVLWTLRLLVEDYSTMKMVLYWVVCCCLAALTVTKYGRSKEKASSAARKIFHILAIAVYIPGLMYECNILYLGSGILLGIFFLLEILRNLKLPPIGSILQECFMALKDEKEAGILATSPIYLLCGFSVPIWIHPAPCDLTDSAYFNILPLLSGILSVGVGDTCASAIGSNYGKHYFRGSKKTVEGTAACILSQLLTIFLLHQLGYLIKMGLILWLRILFAVVATSIVEAKTDQNDNAILPLIMYMILI